MDHSIKVLHNTDGTISILSDRGYRTVFIPNINATDEIKLEQYGDVDLLSVAIFLLAKLTALFYRNKTSKKQTNERVTQK